MVMELFSTRLEEGPPRVLCIGGEIDLATADEFRSALETVVTGGSTAVVDMGDVTFIDAAGLRVIVQVAKTLNGSGPLMLVNAALVERLFELVGMADLPSVEFRETV
jgi:anti-anti-sigma factor